MNRYEIDSLLSSIKSDMNFELANVVNGAVEYEFEDKRNNPSYSGPRLDTGVFIFKRTLKLPRLPDLAIGSFEIGTQDKVEVNPDNPGMYIEKTIPVIKYSCNSVWFGLRLTTVLSNCLKKALRSLQLSTEFRGYIKRFLIGLENQSFLVEKLNSVQKRYDLTSISGSISFQADDVFHTEYTIKDTLDRTQLIGFHHDLPLNLEVRDDFKLIFTWTVVNGSESVASAKSMIISKLEDNLGIFEEQLAADVSP